jgi:hypothetical protein
MDQLTAILKAAMEGYTGKALNGYSYLTSNEEQRLFTVVSVGYLPDKRIVETDLIAQVVGEQIVIELDLNSKPLVDALVQQGIPRSQIIPAYAGKPVPEPS